MERGNITSPLTPVSSETLGVGGMGRRGACCGLSSTPRPAAFNPVLGLDSWAVLSHDTWETPALRGRERERGYLMPPVSQDKRHKGTSVWLRPGRRSKDVVGPGAGGARWGRPGRVRRGTQKASAHGCRQEPANHSAGCERMNGQAGGVTAPPSSPLGLGRLLPQFIHLNTVG